MTVLCQVNNNEKLVTLQVVKNKFTHSCQILLMVLKDLTSAKRENS